MNALDVYSKRNIRDYLARPEEKYDKEYSKERQEKLDRKREDKEGRIETKKIGKIATSIGSTIVKPFSSILDKLLNFFEFN